MSLKDERRPLTDRLDQEGPKRIKYSQAINKSKLAQKVISMFEVGSAKVLKKVVSQAIEKSKLAQKVIYKFEVRSANVLKKVVSLRLRDI